MPKKSVFCIATSRNRAEQIILNLRTAHFASKDLSVVFPDRGFLREPGAEQDTTSGQMKVGRATAGGVQEVAMAWPSGPGALMFAGVGRFTAAGPLLVALGGAGMGETEGALAASLIGLGVPVFEAQQYESRMKEGNILLGVYLEELGSIALARGILAETYGENICVVDMLPAKGVSLDQPTALRG